MDSFPDQSAVEAALALVLQAHRRWLDNQPGGVRLDLADAYMAGAYMTGANMSGANMAGASMVDANMVGACMADATLPHGIVRITAPESEAEPEAG